MDVLPVARATLMSRADVRRGRIERVGPLTPYALQVLLDDARAVGAGAKLELGVPADSDDQLLEATRRQFACLVSRGVEVTVLRDPRSDR